MILECPKCLNYISVLVVGVAGGNFGRFASASSRFPSIFSAQFVNVVVHLLFRESSVLFLTILTHFPSRLEKVANEHFGTEAEMFTLKLFDTILLNVLEFKIKSIVNVEKLEKNSVL